MAKDEGKPKGAAVAAAAQAAIEEAEEGGGVSAIDFEDIFAAFGIEDDEDKKHVKRLAAARVVADKYRSSQAPLEPDPKGKGKKGEKEKWSPYKRDEE